MRQAGKEDDGRPLAKKKKKKLLNSHTLLCTDNEAAKTLLRIIDIIIQAP
jgi:hypothetical protein